MSMISTVSVALKDCGLFSSYLAPCKDSGRESAYSLQKASQLAGSSKRMVGSAVGNVAKGMRRVQETYSTISNLR